MPRLTELREREENHLICTDPLIQDLVRQDTSRDSSHERLTGTRNDPLILDRVRGNTREDSSVPNEIECQSIDSKVDCRIVPALKSVAMYHDDSEGELSTSMSGTSSIDTNGRHQRVCVATKLGMRYSRSCRRTSTR